MQVYRDVPFLGLPDAAGVIREEAFMGMPALQAVALGDELTCIEFLAFADCGNLLFINIPASVKEIADNAFEGCENLQIFCTDGSIGEEYARYHGIPFACIPEN